MSTLPQSKRNAEFPWFYYRISLQDYAKRFDKSIKLFTTDHWLCKILAVLFATVTFNRKNYDLFLKETAVACGPLQFYPKKKPKKWVASKIVHECRHTRQLRICGFGIHPWLGIPIYAIIYFLFPFPFKFAYGRAWLEADACYLNWKITFAEGNITKKEMLWEVEQKAKSLSSFRYGWAVSKSEAIRILYNAASRAMSEAQW